MSPAFIDNDGRLNWRKIGYHARSAFAVLLAIAVLGGGGWFVYSKANDAYIEWRTQDDYIGEGTEAVEVLIPPGGPTPTQIGDLLTEAGVVKSTKTFRKVAIESGRWSELKAGRYKVKKQLPSEAALDMILDQKNLVVLDVLFQEGTTLAEQQQIILKKDKLDVKEDALMAAYDGTKYSNLPDYAGGKLEGFLFPAKYQVAEPVDPVAIVTTQLKQYGNIAGKLDLVNRAKELGITPMQAVTTASIIASEVPDKDDQPMVAAVIYNRIKKGMMLQMDSTVHYAVGKSGKVTTTAEDRANPSPYNTYVHTGFPPGPISNPGETALAAALQPAATDALFFVTVNPSTGDTRFAATEEEHQANVKLFQQWCSENKGSC